MHMPKTGMANPVTGQEVASIWWTLAMCKPAASAPSDWLRLAVISTAEDA